MGSVSERTLALLPGSVTTVDPNGMSAVAQSTPRSKGGEIELRNRLGAYVGVMTSVVPGSSAYLGTLALSYSRDLGLAAVRVRASAASFDSQQDIYRSSMLRATAAADVLLPIVARSAWALQLGPSVGVPMVRQRDMNGTVSSSFGFAYGAVLVTSAHLYGHTYLSLDLQGGGEVFRLDGERVHRASGSALLGGVVAF